MMMRLKSLLLFAPLLVFAAGPVHAVVKCTDEKGVTYYGDTLPPQCDKRAITEINTQGIVVRKIEAALTPEQLKAKADEKQKNADSDRLKAIQRLKDNALLSTYGADREFDRARDRDIGQLDARQKTIKGRVASLDKQVAGMEKEMEFYKAGKSKSAKTREAPPQLQQDLQRAKQDREAIDVELAKLDSDKVSIGERYETEKQRWKRLKAGMPLGTLTPEELAALDASTKAAAKAAAAKAEAAAAAAAKAAPGKK